MLARALVRHSSDKSEATNWLVGKFSASSLVGCPAPHPISSTLIPFSRLLKTESQITQMINSLFWWLLLVITHFYAETIARSGTAYLVQELLNFK